MAQRAQMLFGLFEDMPLLGIEVAACSIDVEAQHGHGAGQWTASSRRAR
jgi:hypothetical protein